MTTKFTRIAVLFLVLAVPFSTILGAEEGGEGAGAPASVVRITVDGAISPITADYIEREVKRAGEMGADLLVLQLDTPGGLVTSTRQIVKVLYASKVPVVVHVAPPGARAASAGVFITMAAHVAAMAPGTNIGAAHPVNVGGGNPLSPKKDTPEKDTSKGPAKGGEDKDPEPGTRNGEGEKGAPASDDENVMAQKILNDTVSFARSIAEKQGRNADWAERAVRESVSVTEKEALELNVIDLIAEDMDELLEALEGRAVKISGEEIVLALAGASVEERPMAWRHRVLGAVSDPNLAYIFLMLGIYGLFFELANPGVVLPGVLGGIFLILAFFSFQVLPINYAGILLIVVAVVLFILEVKVVSYGMLSVGGIASLFLGSIMLFDKAEPYYRLSLSLVLGVTGFTALFFVVGLGMAVRMQRKRPTTGVEGLVGTEGMVTVGLDPEGSVRVQGEIWRATGDRTIEAGSRVRVTAVEGMKLKVEKIGDG